MTNVHVWHGEGAGHGNRTGISLGSASTHLTTQKICRWRNRPFSRSSVDPRFYGRSKRTDWVHPGSGYLPVPSEARKVRVMVFGRLDMRLDTLYGCLFCWSLRLGEVPTGGERPRVTVDGVVLWGVLVGRRRLSAPGAGRLTSKSAGRQWQTILEDSELYSSTRVQFCPLIAKNWRRRCQR